MREKTIDPDVQLRREARLEDHRDRIDQPRRHKCGHDDLHALLGCQQAPREEKRNQRDNLIADRRQAVVYPQRRNVARQNSDRFRVGQRGEQRAEDKQQQQDAANQTVRPDAGPDLQIPDRQHQGAEVGYGVFVHIRQARQVEIRHRGQQHIRPQNRPHKRLFPVQMLKQQRRDHGPDQQHQIGERIGHCGVSDLCFGCGRGRLPLVCDSKFYHTGRFHAISRWPTPEDMLQLCCSVSLRRKRQKPDDFHSYL